MTTTWTLSTQYSAFSRDVHPPPGKEGTSHVFGCLLLLKTSATVLFLVMAELCAMNIFLGGDFRNNWSCSVPLGLASQEGTLPRPTFIWHKMWMSAMRTVFLYKLLTAQTP